MHFDDLKKLSKEDIVFRMKKDDCWRLQDIILLAFGYDHEGVDWDYISSTNAFPIREYCTALAATNELNLKKRLNYISKKESPRGLARVMVKKRDFFEWARIKWINDPEVQRVYSIWKNRKQENKSITPSLETNCAKVKNFGDKIQIEEFIEHCKKGRPPEKYKANLSAIVRKLKGQIPFTFHTFRKYISRMTIEELKVCAKSSSQKPSS